MSIELKTNGEGVEYVTLFTIDDKEFQVPAKPRANVGLRYMNLLAKKGDEIANDFILSKSLGDEGYEALMEWDGLTNEVLNQIIEAATKIIMGDAATNPNS